MSGEGVMPKGYDYDMVIRGGTIVDGTGHDSRRGDVAVRGDRIAAVGEVSGRGAEELDASGLIVTPGFVDIHTHYDGQVIWEDRLFPSSGHGVTTVVIGNCGVGFAPCRPEDRDRLVRLMEGVEDIPGVVMADGLSWAWETYPQYLEAIERRPHDINIASYLPHSPLRVYVMGERAAQGEMATEQDRARMAAIASEAMKAGAIGFASSRTMFHRASDGSVVPTVDAGEEELTAIARAIGESGGGLIQIAADYRGYSDIDGEFGILRRVAREAGMPMSLPMNQSHSEPNNIYKLLNHIKAANSDGLSISGQMLPRGVGALLGLDLSLNPFSLTPAYQEIADLPLSARVERMLSPQVRARILDDRPGDAAVPLAAMVRRFDEMFPMSDPLDYEPRREEAIGPRARRLGIRPEELAYDLLLELEGRAFLYLPFLNYAHGNLDAIGELIQRDEVVLGLGDGGAHCGIICDAAYPTFMLSYWARDRTRGPQLALASAVRMMTRDTARVVGLYDRGVVAPGYRADLNLIDHAGLRLHAPQAWTDLPAGGKRLVQRADGYVATIVDGEIVYRNGVATGRLPGRLVRGPQARCDG
jgi:N-acyl-D-amino-acid deacylase